MPRIPLFAGSQGAVINISAGLAIMPTDKLMAYGVAKAAQDKLTKDLAFEFASKGVRVNSILPGEFASIFAGLHFYSVWLSQHLMPLHCRSTEPKHACL